MISDFPVFCIGRAHHGAYKMRTVVRKLNYRLLRSKSYSVNQDRGFLPKISINAGIFLQIKLPRRIKDSSSGVNDSLPSSNITLKRFAGLIPSSNQIHQLVPQPVIQHCFRICAGQIISIFVSIIHQLQSRIQRDSLIIKSAVLIPMITNRLQQRVLYSRLSKQHQVQAADFLIIESKIRKRRDCLSNQPRLTHAGQKNSIQRKRRDSLSEFFLFLFNNPQHILIRYQLK